MKDRNTSDFLKERRKIDRKHAQFKYQLEQKRIVGKTWGKRITDFQKAVQ